MDNTTAMYDEMINGAQQAPAFDLLSEFTVYAPISNGDSFTVKLGGAVSRVNPNYDANDPKSIKGYVDFNWIRISDGRSIKDSRQYPVGINILVEQLQEQKPDLPVSINLAQLVNYLMTEDITFTCWCVVNESNNQFYKNYQFKAPFVRGNDTADVDTDDGI